MWDSVPTWWTPVRTAGQLRKTRLRLHLVLGNFKIKNEHIQNLSVFGYCTWNSYKELDRIFMAVERKLRLGHGAVRNETTGHHSIPRVTAKCVCQQMKFLENLNIPNIGGSYTCRRKHWKEAEMLALPRPLRLER